MQMADHRKPVRPPLIKDALQEMWQDRRRQGRQQDMIGRFLLARLSARVNPPKCCSAAQDVLVRSPCQNLGSSLGSPVGVTCDGTRNLDVRRCRLDCNRHRSATSYPDSGSNRQARNSGPTVRLTGHGISVALPGWRNGRFDLCPVGRCVAAQEFCRAVRRGAVGRPGNARPRLFPAWFRLCGDGGPIDGDRGHCVCAVQRDDVPAVDAPSVASMGCKLDSHSRLAWSHVRPAAPPSWVGP
jgi:hypothetical protein